MSARAQLRGDCPPVLLRPAGPHPPQAGRLGMIRLRHRPAPPPAAEPGDVLVEAERVTVRLGRRDVLAGVDVTARAGEVLALVGPNGAGKSTLLSALAADLAPTAGT